MLVKEMIDFIIIGSMKSGTTTLNEYLDGCDEIEMCHPKEPQFFSRYYDKGFNYFDSLFSNDNRIKGEASTCYSRFPEYKDVPERIFNYNPDIKLIYILRNPIERAYSHYSHNVITDNIQYKSFEEAIEVSNEVVSASKYMMQIEQYLKYFKESQLLLLDFDELKDNPRKVINDVLLFVGGKSINKDKKLKRNIDTNAAGSAVSYLKFTSAILFIRKLPVIKGMVNFLIPEKNRTQLRKKMVSMIMKTPLLKMYQRKQIKNLSPMTEYTKKKLLEELEADIIKLERFWKKDLSKWKD